MNESPQNFLWDCDEINFLLPFCESRRRVLPDFLLPTGKDLKTSDFSYKNTQHQFFVSIAEMKKKSLQP